MRISLAIATTGLTILLQGCSFTNRAYETNPNNTNTTQTSATLKENQEKIVSIGELAFEALNINQERNTIYCPEKIEYRDGIAKYIIPAGKYKALGSIEVEPGVKLPFILGSYQPGAIGGAPGYHLYFPIKKDGTLYHSYYTDAFNNLSSGQKKGELKEWGGNAKASTSCTPITPISPAEMNHCIVHYAGPTRANGYLASRLHVDDFNSKRLEVTSAGITQTFCGVTIKVHEASDTFYFTVIKIDQNQ